MKTFTVALVFLLSAALSARATKYYFSSTSGDDSRTATQAQSPSTPWRTLAKLNAISSGLKAGDTVFLQCGNIFPGPLRINASGASGAPIVVTSYGSGAQPIVTGFAKLSSWTSLGGNMWVSSCPGTTSVNMVKINDQVTPMGRWPNSDATNGGYATIESHTDSTNITNTVLSTTPNWTGAELVIRKNNYVIERDQIAAHSGTTIRYYSTSSVIPLDKFGFFVQNSVKTLDQNGEWFYDKGTRKMYLYSTTNPSTVAILASVVDTLVFIYKRAYVTLNNINFQGSNMRNVFLMQSNYISVTNCRILQSGMDGIKTIQSTYNTFKGLTIDYSNNDGIDIDGANNLIQDCNIIRSGTIPGVGNANASYIGINIFGDNNTIQYCKIDTAGYMGINFVGQSNTIKNNFVNYFNMTKDDGGGIYTWMGNQPVTSTRVMGWITGNIVTNGVTNPNGTDKRLVIAHGIYLDYNVGIGTITGNTVSNCSIGIFLQDSRSITVTNNTLFHNQSQIALRHGQSAMVFTGNDVHDNTCVSLNEAEYNVQGSSIDYVNGTPPLTSWAYMHANKYARVSPVSSFFFLGCKSLNQTGSSGLWKSTYAMDYDSKELPLSYAPYNVNYLIGSNLYTKGPIITQFSTATLGSRVIVTAPIGAVTAGKAYVTHFTLHSPDADHQLMVFIQSNTSPYPHLTDVIKIPSASPSSNNTVVLPITASDPNAAIVFMMYSIDPRIYIDNIDLYQASVTANDPNANYLFKYNASKSAVTIPLSTTYQDVNGTAYSGSVTLQPYTSIVLFKK